MTPTFLRAAALALPLALIAGAAMADPIPFDELANATFTGLEEGTITLENGQWQGEPIMAGIATRPTARLADLVVAGDLDGDAVDETVALLNYSGGGTGTFLYVAVFVPTPAGPENVSTLFIGDRIPVRGMAIVDGDIVLDIVQQGPEDGACCATQKARLTIALDDGALTTMGIEEQGTISTADLDGDWVLTELTFDEPPLPETEITATFAGGALTGSAGCNRFTTTYSAGEGVTDITVAPVATTRMACAPPILAQEGVFLTRLAAVDAFGFAAGKMWLSYTLDGDYGLLTFARAPAN